LSITFSLRAVEIRLWIDQSRGRRDHPAARPAGREEDVIVRPRDGSAARKT
jgi:hypothetical protein